MDMALAGEDQLFIIYASIQRGYNYVTSTSTIATVYDPAGIASKTTLLDDGVCKLNCFFGLILFFLFSIRNVNETRQLFYRLYLHLDPDMVSRDGIYSAFYHPVVDGVYWISLDTWRGTGSVSPSVSGQPYYGALPIDQSK